MSKHYLIKVSCVFDNLTGSLTLPGSLPSAHSGERLASVHTGLEGRNTVRLICPVWNINLIAVLIEKNLTNTIT